ncbi:MAG: hypothetical protein Q8M03_14915 [Legionella sp.]|nr:hypothetical protein [Legionella sp.]
MKRKGLLCVLGLLLSHSTFAMDFVSRNYEFKPGIPQAVENPVWWQLHISCAITATDDADVLTGIMKKKSASINGVVLKEGESTSLSVKNGDMMYIVIDASARVEITNYGKSTVKAKCST